MKTTLDLPDDLLIAAKKLAAERRTTLKDMVTRSLRREVGFDPTVQTSGDSRYELSELGLPRLRKRGATVDLELVERIESEIESEEFEAALAKRSR